MTEFSFFWVNYAFKNHISDFVLVFFQNDIGGLLAYSLKICMSRMQNKKFRNDVLRVLVKLYMNLEKPDFINVCQVSCPELVDFSPAHSTEIPFSLCCFSS